MNLLFKGRSSGKPNDASSVSRAAASRSRARYPSYLSSVSAVPITSSLQSTETPADLSAGPRPTPGRLTSVATRSVAASATPSGDAWAGVIAVRRARRSSASSSSRRRCAVSRSASVSSPSFAARG